MTSGRSRTLENDKQFIRTLKGSPDIEIYEASTADAFEFIHAPTYEWSRKKIIIKTSGWNHIGAVRPHSYYSNMLKVNGVTIHGFQLTELAGDLIVADANGQTFHLMVNRQGLCFLEMENEQMENEERRIKRLRINDHFGWSKYGVKPCISTIWSVWDMHTGEVLLAPPTTTAADGGEVEEEDDRSAIYHRWKKLQEEKDKLMEKMESLLMKSRLLLDGKKE